MSPIILDNKIIGAVEVFRNITKEKEIDKAKTEFVSLASHQLRTPLTTVSWYAEMILKGDVGKVVPEQKKYLEEIYHGNQRMIELVNTLLDVSRLELGTFKIESKPTDIVSLALDVLFEQKPRIEEKRLVITEDFSKYIPMYHTDPKLLRMVFQNLLANAVEHTPLGGKIEFSITTSPDSLLDKKGVVIKISDTGYGIPKGQHNQIFTKLFRADNVKDKDTDGTGLGLYIVKSIVENFGGKIQFDSEGNKGSTFYVMLPMDGKK
ncbi:MAG: HAMP domain-containing sensor histidine kinase [Candidatus Taylorbacteria bacterium]|nr:HAMP domain-containing sensor histidine kinase [Candidatus Taylorbacteria bacterium]